MKTIKRFGSALGLSAVLILGGCANMDSTPYPPNPNVARSGNAYPSYGVVRSIDVVQQEKAASGIGLGTVAGAVIGGVLGHQVGAGRGNTLATVAGAAGGAYVGHALDNRPSQQVEAYRIGVRMEDGSYQTLTQSSLSDIRVGDRVRLENGGMQRY